MNWQRNSILRHIRARPHLVLALGIGLALYFGLPYGATGPDATRFLISWNAAVCLYLVLAGAMMARSSSENIRQRAIEQDEGAYAVLLVVVIAVVASLLAIVEELSVVRKLGSPARVGHIALAALTVVMSWAFMHLMFAVHYAHDYYLNLSRKLPAGLEFPGDDAPDYGDFLYLAGVIGTSGQTADVSLTTRAMRRLGLAHCVLAFFFNTSVLALTINIAANLLQG